MKNFLIILSLVFSSFALQATQQLKITLNVEESNEYSDSDSFNAEDHPNWIDDYGVLTFEQIITIADLPFSTCTESTCLDINKDGGVNLGTSFGDTDQSVHSSSIIPMLNGDFIKLTNDYKLSVSGGDHASGSWSSYLTLNIKYL